MELRTGAESDFAFYAEVGVPFFQKNIKVEASHAKVTYAAAFKRNPLLPFSHTFGLNTRFCYYIAATRVV